MNSLADGETIVFSEQLIPVYSDVKSNSSKFGRLNMSMNIVGVPYNDVHLHTQSSCMNRVYRDVTRDTRLASRPTFWPWPRHQSLASIIYISESFCTTRFYFLELWNTLLHAGKQSQIRIFQSC